MELEDLTIKEGETECTPVPFNSLRWLDSLMIQPPDELDALVSFTVYVTARRNPTANDWTPLTSGGANVTVKAGKAVVLTEVPFCGLKIVAESAVAAERKFMLSGEEHLP